MRTALLGWLWAQSQGAQFLLRIEDLDSSRCKPAFTDAIFRDLEFLGLTWSGEVLFQSQRASVYDDYLNRLREKNLAYPCRCTRSEIARAASAPHAGEEGPVYPRTCRQSPPDSQASAALRFGTSAHATTFEDELRGLVVQDVSRAVGDFVVRRPDGVASYQLAVVVDDALSKVTHVLRGDDLLFSTPRQLLLYDALSFEAPRFAHVPLLLESSGKRLAKREGATTMAHWREKKVAAEVIVGRLAQWSGLSNGEPTTAAALAKEFSLAKISREPCVVLESELDAST
jgi:glutamyl-tRNA synthetase